MHQVSRHEEMLYKMDTKMFIMTKTIQDIMMGIDFFSIWVWPTGLLSSQSS